MRSSHGAGIAQCYGCSCKQEVSGLGLLAGRWHLLHDTLWDGPVCLLTDEWADRRALTLTARLLGPLLGFTCERMRNVLFVLFCSKVTILFGRMFSLEGPHLMVLRADS